MRSSRPSARSGPRPSRRPGCGCATRRGLLELVSGRPERRAGAFRAAERLAGAARHRAHPRPAAALPHAADARAAGRNAARRTGPRRDGRAGARQRARCAIAVAVAAARPGRPGGGGGRARARPGRLGAAARTPTSGTSRRSCSRRSPATRSAPRGAARRALERALDLAAAGRPALPVPARPAPRACSSATAGWAPHTPTLIAEILTVLAGPGTRLAGRTAARTTA